MTLQKTQRVGVLRREGAWALVDQALSSGTNFVPSLILARYLGPTAYGTFSIAFLAWFLTLSVIRSALMQPYTLIASSLPPVEWRSFTARASGVVLGAGACGSVAFGIAGLAFGPRSSLGLSLLAIAVLAPGLALQEFWRSASFSTLRAKTATANDLCWALGQAVAFTILFAFTTITPAESLIAWGAGAWLAAGLGFFQLAVRARPSRSAYREAREWIRVGSWFTGANVTFSAGLFAVTVIVGAVVGQHGLGLFRMVQGNLFGPVQLGIIAAEMVFFPHLARSARTARAERLRQAVRYSTGIAAAVMVYGVVLLIVARSFLVAVFGQAFAPATALVLPMLVAFVLDAATDGATVSLRAKKCGKSLVTSQVVGTATRVISVLLLVHVAGIVGAAWGLVAGSAVTGVLSWLLLRRLSRLDAWSDGEVTPVETAIVVPAQVAVVSAAAAGSSQRGPGRNVEPT